MSIPRSAGELPVFYNHKPSAQKGYVFSDGKPLYSFGYGLSFTQFAYSNLVVTPQCMNPEEKALISVDVTNIGKLPGDEVVQLYVQDEISSVTRPIIELKGFKKISLVPGEKRNVAFEIGPEELGLFDREMNFIVEPGSFKIMVGPNQQDVLVAVLDVTS